MLDVELKTNSFYAPEEWLWNDGNGTINSKLSHYCEINHSHLFAYEYLYKMLHCYCVCVFIPAINNMMMETEKKERKNANAFISHKKWKNNNIFLKYNFHGKITVMPVWNCILNEDCYFVWMHVYWTKYSGKEQFQVVTSFNFYVMQSSQPKWQ